MASPEISFAPSIIYGVDLPEISQQVQVKLQRDGYDVKNEFHITLADAKYRSRLQDEQIKLIIGELAKHAPFDIEFDGALYAISKPKVIGGQAYERRSIVTPVHSPDIISWLGNITSRMEIEPPEQPFLHVTVATAPDTVVARRGIGIASRDEWQALHPVRYAGSWAAP